MRGWSGLRLVLAAGPPPPLPVLPSREGRHRPLLSVMEHLQDSFLFFSSLDVSNAATPGHFPNWYLKKYLPRLQANKQRAARTQKINAIARLRGHFFFISPGERFHVGKKLSEITAAGTESGTRLPRERAGRCFLLISYSWMLSCHTIMRCPSHGASCRWE